MTNDGYPEQQHNNQALWNAIFAGTRLRHLDANDARVFVLTAILWGRQESKVIDVNTGEVFRFPWNELEFLDPVESNLPGFPEAAHKT
jgi:hypothetical protein